VTKVFLRLVAGWILVGSAGAIVMLARPTVWTSTPLPARKFLYPLFAFLLLVAFPASVGAIRLWKLQMDGLLISAVALCSYALAEVALLSLDAFVVSRPVDPRVFGRLALDALALRWLLSSAAREACASAKRRENP